MNYFETRKKSNKLKAFIDFEKKYYRFIFDKSLLSHKVYYDRNRYYVFTIDLVDVFKNSHSCTRGTYIHKVNSCNKRKEIGSLLSRDDFTLKIVYYDTSKSFRFYMYTSVGVIRLDKKGLSKLDLWWFQEWIRGNK